MRTRKRKENKDFTDTLVQNLRKIVVLQTPCQNVRKINVLTTPCSKTSGKSMFYRHLGLKPKENQCFTDTLL